MARRPCDCTRNRTEEIGRRSTIVLQPQTGSQQRFINVQSILNPRVSQALLEVPSRAPSRMTLELVTLSTLHSAANYFIRIKLLHLLLAHNLPLSMMPVRTSCIGTPLLQLLLVGGQSSPFHGGAKSESVKKRNRRLTRMRRRSGAPVRFWDENHSHLAPPRAVAARYLALFLLRSLGPSLPKGARARMS